MGNKKLSSLVLLSLSSALVLAACGGEGSTADSSGSAGATDSDQVLNLVESAEIPTMDSVQATDTVAFTALSNVNEGLYRQGLDGTVELGIAAEDPTVSEDGLVYTFTIRDEANWSNGEPVTAEDFVYSWRKLVDPAEAASYSYMMAGVIANATEVIDAKASADCARMRYCRCSLCIDVRRSSDPLPQISQTPQGVTRRCRISLQFPRAILALATEAIPRTGEGLVYKFLAADRCSRGEVTNPAMQYLRDSQIFQSGFIVLTFQQFRRVLGGLVNSLGGF